MSVEPKSTKILEEVAAKAVTTEATFELLMAKPRRSLSFDVTTCNADGDEVVLKVKYLAIDGKAYDDLTAAHPPTAADKKAGGTYNVDTLAPALISAVSSVPKLTVAQATSLYKSPDWSGGEVGNLFMNAVRVCNAGLDVPFSARD
jgi:hypothetical protein